VIEASQVVRRDIQGDLVVIIIIVLTIPDIRVLIIILNQMVEVVAEAEAEAMAEVAVKTGIMEMVDIDIMEMGMDIILQLTIIGTRMAKVIIRKIMGINSILEGINICNIISIIRIDIHLCQVMLIKWQNSHLTGILLRGIIIKHPKEILCHKCHLSHNPRDSIFRRGLCKQYPSTVRHSRFCSYVAHFSTLLCFLHSKVCRSGSPGFD
jgi:Zn finger protein HypA/HybF involved in hydrogenase expression